MRWSRVICAVGAVGVVVAACGSGSDRAAREDGTQSATVSSDVAPGVAPAPPAAYGKGSADQAGGGALGSVGRVAEAGPRSGRPGSRTEVTTVDMSEVRQGMDVASQGSTVRPGSLPVDAAMPMIIRTGSATIEVDSLEPAIARLRLIASQLGGFVGNTSVQGGREEVRSATVEIKIPAQRWSQLLEGLKPIGKIESQIESAEDVGEEFTDVTARVSNARRLEDRLVALLANRTGKLEEVLSVERELARVREEIERYEGRLRYLRSRAALSTMTVMLHEPAPVLGNRPGSNPIADAFRAAWRNFVGLVAGLISMMGVLVPLGLLGWLGWKLLKSVRGTRGKRDEG